MKQKKSLERPNYYLNDAERTRWNHGTNHNTSESEKMKELFLSKCNIKPKISENHFDRNSKKINEILENWGDNDYQYLKFMCLYDRNIKVLNQLSIMSEGGKSFQDCSDT